VPHSQSFPQLEQILRKQKEQSQLLLQQLLDIQGLQVLNSVEKHRKYCVCLCTDFVAPKLGGVETHSYQLA